MDNKKLFEIIGRLYVDIFGTNQMLTHLQTVLTQKDEEIKTLKGQLLDKDKPDDGIQEG